MRYNEPRTKNFGTIYNCAFILNTPDPPARKVKVSCRLKAESAHSTTAADISVTTIIYAGRRNQGEKTESVTSKSPSSKRKTNQKGSTKKRAKPDSTHQTPTSDSQQENN